MLPLEVVGLDEVVDIKRNPYTVLVYNIGMNENKIKTLRVLTGNQRPFSNTPPITKKRRT